VVVVPIILFLQPELAALVEQTAYRGQVAGLVVVVILVVVVARLAILMLALFWVVIMASQEPIPVETVEGEV
jgi:hypothetical protein